MSALTPVIRKIIVGADYKNAMTFSCGQNVASAGRISTISIDGNNWTHIYVSSGERVRLWKSISPGVPITLEFDLN